ncbi:MAG TPA: hypothetical protein VGM29_17620 [Polyangiaceae bacterium]
MTREQDLVRASPDASNEPQDAQNGQDTLRALDPEKPADASEVYVEPLPLPKVSDHKTLEVDTVKLAAEIDPRKRPTELKLGRVRRTSDANPSSHPPPEGPVTRTEAPSDSKTNRNALAIAGVLLLCVASFLLARSLRSRFSSPAVAPQSAVQNVATAPPLPPVARAPLSMPSIVTVAPLAPSSAPPTGAAGVSSSAAPTPVPELAQKMTLHHPAQAPSHADAARALPASDAKLKHPIY